MKLRCVRDQDRDNHKTTFSTLNQVGFRSNNDANFSQLTLILKKTDRKTLHHQNIFKVANILNALGL